MAIRGMRCRVGWIGFRQRSFGGADRICPRRCADYRAALHSLPQAGERERRFVAGNHRGLDGRRLRDTGQAEGKPCARCRHSCRRPAARHAQGRRPAVGRRSRPPAAWIADGAKWPDSVVVRERSKADAAWWSLQPLAATEPPAPARCPRRGKSTPSIGSYSRSWPTRAVAVAAGRQTGLDPARDL